MKSNTLTDFFDNDNIVELKIKKTGNKTHEMNVRVVENGVVTEFFMPCVQITDDSTISITSHINTEKDKPNYFSNELNFYVGISGMALATDTLGGEYIIVTEVK